MKALIKQYFGSVDPVLRGIYFHNASEAAAYTWEAQFLSRNNLSISDVLPKIREYQSIGPIPEKTIDGFLKQIVDKFIPKPLWEGK
jgi:hypothetical protein